MADNLPAAIPIVMLIGGMALIVYAAYLYYVALPEEHTRRHAATRAAIAVVGVVLVLLGSRVLG
jgi:hypothetical protein